MQKVTEASDEMIHAGFSTVHGLCLQSNFISNLSGLCICWLKHFSVSEPLAFFSRVQGRATSRYHQAAECFCSGSYALSSAPQWDYDRSVRCQQELMNIPFHKAWVILTTKCPPH